MGWGGCKVGWSKMGVGWVGCMVGCRVGVGVGGWGGELHPLSSDLVSSCSNI